MQEKWPQQDTLQSTFRCAILLTSVSPGSESILKTASIPFFFGGQVDTVGHHTSCVYRSPSVVTYCKRSKTGSGMAWERG